MFFLYGLSCRSHRCALPAGWRFHRALLPLVLLAGLFVSTIPAGAQFSISRPPAKKYSERGLMFALPANGDWDQLGAFIGHIGSPLFFQMTPHALKIAHGRLEKFMPADQIRHAYFPYNELKEYEQQEMASGRPPIFVTATYKGAKRPVYFLPGQPEGAPPSVPLSQVAQAVNVRDERFIQFWINRYARPILDSSPPNTWIGLDDCRFMVRMYGILDDDGNFVSGVPWDRPFPLNDDEFLDGLKHFFKRLKELAPDIKVMCNIAGFNDWRRFTEVYADVPGIMNEDILTVQETPLAFMRLKTYRQFLWYRWLADNSRVAVLRAGLPVYNADLLRTALMTYLVLRGPRFYFAPQVEATNREVDPSEYIAMRSALGDPVSEMESAREPGAPNEGYRLFWRRCARGIVYLNYTGRQQVIPLPADRIYYNRLGLPITELVLDDIAGDYVLTHIP